MINLKPIGTIHTPFKNLEKMPIQPAGAQGVLGTVEFFPEYAAGLKDLEGFSHIILLYVFHGANNFSLTVKPFLDVEFRGLFSTRAPKRPNPIGLSIVKLITVDNLKLYVKGVDILDGTPVLDVKPYVPEFDCPSGPVRVGWLEKSKGQVHEKKSDSRFK